MASFLTRLKSVFIEDDFTPVESLPNAVVESHRSERRDYSLNQPFPFIPLSPTNIAVNRDSVLGLPPAFSAIRYISEGIAMLDRRVMKKNGEVAENHDLTPFFNGKPHPHYTWFDFTAALIYNACIGNGYALISRDEATMRPVSLELIPPDRCRPMQADDGTVYYYIDDVLYPYTDVIHIKGMSVNGLQGKDITILHRSIFASAQAGNEYTENVFGNRATPSIAVKHSQALDADERKNLEDNIIARHGGTINAGRPFILDDGMEIQYLQWSPNDIALMDFKDLSVRDCCRIFKVPADMMALDDKGTYGATKVRSKDFLIHCLGPWIEKVQEEFNAKLFYEEEFFLEKYRFEYNTLMYLRLDDETEALVQKTNIERLAIAVRSTLMSPNEARKELKLPPMPDGDKLFGDINLLPLDQLVEVALAKYLSSEGEKGRNEQQQQQNSTDNEQPAAQSGE